VRREAAQGGYTLLELLVVLAIIALSAVTLTSFAPTHQQVRDLKLEAYRLESDLRAARNRAIFGGEAVHFMVDVAQSTWRYGDKPTHQLRDGIRLTLHTGRALLNGSNTGAIVFLPNGQSSGGYIVMEAQGSQTQIDVDWLTGRIHEHGSEAAQ
jgi:general secretion pathway protein H